MPLAPLLRDMSDRDVEDVVNRLRGFSDFMPLAAPEGVRLVGRRAAAGKEAFLSLETARSARRVRHGLRDAALQALGLPVPATTAAGPVTARAAERREWEGIWRALVTEDGVVPVSVARRAAELAAAETRVACADALWELGTAKGERRAEGLYLRVAAQKVGEVRLPTDSE